jgi:hypothetical protein
MSRAKTFIAAVLAALLLLPPSGLVLPGEDGCAYAGEPRRLAVIEVRAVEEDVDSARELEEELRTAFGRKSDVEIIPSSEVQAAIRDAGFELPLIPDNATLTRIGEIAGADLVFFGYLGRERTFDVARGKLIRVKTGGEWRNAEEYCLCRTVEGRERAAERIADELLGSWFGLPSKKALLQIGAAAVIGGVLVAVIREIREDEPIPEGFPGIPDPPAQ